MASGYPQHLSFPLFCEMFRPIGTRQKTMFLINLNVFEI